LDHIKKGILDDDMPPLPANMSQSSLAPSAMLVSAQSALANEAALLFNPALSPSHHHQSLAAQAPQSESESLPLQGSSHFAAAFLTLSNLHDLIIIPLSYLIKARSHL
jgi:hypothetical protein